MRNRILYLLWGCILGMSVLPAVGQTFIFYEYQTIENADTAYYAVLLNRMADGTAHAKILFQDPRTQNNYRVACQLTEQVDTVVRQADTTYSLYLKTTAINYELGDQNEVFAKPDFLFTLTQDDSTANFEPSGIRLPGRNGELPLVKTIKLLTYIDLTANFVGLFYAATDPAFNNIFALNTKGLSLVERKTKLHLIAVAQVNDPKIGVTCAIDLKNIIGQFTSITQFLGIEIVIYKISSNNYSKANVESSLRALKPNFNDIVVFYFSGHGFRKPNDKRRFPYIDLTNKPEEDYNKNSMNIQDIYNTIVQKKARLNIVLSDCCNSDFESTNVVGAPSLVTRSSGPAFKMDQVKALFFNPRPMSVLATGADEGQLATGNPLLGGFFSFHFLRFLQADLSTASPNRSNRTGATWENVLRQARLATFNRALITNCAPPNEPLRGCKQFPWYFVQR